MPANLIKLLPPQDYLLACFIYDMLTGVLTWRPRPREHFPSVATWTMWNTRYAGKAAGSIDNKGYRCVILNRRNYGAHRLIWKITTGEEPPAVLDHINGNPADNRFANLRAVTWTQQNWNKGTQKNNTSGFRGVIRLPKGKYAAIIKKRWLGTFKTAEEASAVYEAEARRQRGTFYREK